MMSAAPAVGHFKNLFSIGFREHAGLLRTSILPAPPSKLSWAKPFAPPGFLSALAASMLPPGTPGTLVGARTARPFRDRSRGASGTSSRRRGSPIAPSCASASNGAASDIDRSPLSAGLVASLRNGHLFVLLQRRR